MDYYRPDIPSPEKKQRHPLRILILAALCLILVAVLGYVLSTTLLDRWRGPGRLVETHIKAINSGDFRFAYTHFTSQYREQVSFQEFHSGFGNFVDQLPCRSLSLDRLEVSSRRAVVEGVLTGRDGAVVPIHNEWEQRRHPCPS